MYITLPRPFARTSSLIVIIILFLLSILISSTVASECPLGTRSTGSACQRCPAGTYASYDANECIPCPADTFNPFRGVVSRALCQSCPPFETSVPGSAHCTPCRSGTRAACGKCVRCSRGWQYSSYQCDCVRTTTGITPRPNMDSPQSCPYGMKPNARHTKCVSAICEDGYEFNGYECQPCDYNTFRLGRNMTRCVTCPFGSVTNNFVGPNTQCVQCKPGSYVSDYLPQTITLESVPYCATCPEGTTTRGWQKPLCRASEGSCPPNSFLDHEGDCQICDYNFRLNLDRQMCEPCPKGFAARRGVSDTCEKCPEGSTGDPKNGQCQCAPGQGLIVLPSWNSTPPPSPHSPSDACFPCPAGTYSGTYSTSNMCVPCRNGFISGPGATQCTKCEKGFDTVEDDLTVCVPSLSRCKGRRFYFGLPYEASFASASCVSRRTGCPRNTQAIRGNVMEDAVLCEDKRTGEIVCPPGSVFDGISCEGCGRGRYMAATNDSSQPHRLLSCQRCPGGSVSLGGIATSCTPCKEGFTSRPGECYCDRDHFIDVDGTCKKCGPNSTATEYNSPQCTLCVNGFVKGRLPWGCVCPLPKVVDGDGMCVDDDSGAPEYDRY